MKKYYELVKEDRVWKLRKAGTLKSIQTSSSRLKAMKNALRFVNSHPYTAVILCKKDGWF